MKLNKKYIVDLSEAKAPSDIVFEISNIMENPEASNQNIWLKLGNIDLNQSQILSINSLVSSINSTLNVIESDSEETQKAAEALGISTHIEKELEANAPEAQVLTEKEKPTEQYIPMSDHLDLEVTRVIEEIKENNLSEDVLKSDYSVFDELKSEIEAEKEEISENETQKEEKKETLNDSQKEEVCEEETSDEDIEEKSEPDEEIQGHLDSIFDTETKLENILADEQNIDSTKNWPLAKEAEDIEIPDEVMTDEDYAILQMPTQYHKQTVRSGQVIQSNGNVVIIGDCHPGCEIQAAGDITVWGVLGGIAHAGCKGNTKAKIRALNLNAIQLRIAESYARRPDHIKNIYIEKTNTFTPEEARNINGSIVILKINDN